MIKRCKTSNYNYGRQLDVRNYLGRQTTEPIPGKGLIGCSRVAKNVLEIGIQFIKGNCHQILKLSAKYSAILKIPP